MGFAELLIPRVGSKGLEFPEDPNALHISEELITSQKPYITFKPKLLKHGVSGPSGVGSLNLRSVGNRRQVISRG